MEPHGAARLLQKKRTTNFREDETKLLIQLWGSTQIQNKLYLTHRKEPVMRLLAASMQQRGFYRTPDEIKTRIRNLKCLYHRIKRTVQSGSGFGTVDPDWPHYKAMDHILTRQTNRRDLYRDNILDGPRCEDIKQEMDDIDINDDMESYTTNSMGGSEFEEDQHMPMPPTLIPAPKEKAGKSGTTPKSQIQVKNLPKILPNVTVNANKPGALGSIPFPLLILNGMPQQNQNSGGPNAKNDDNRKYPSQKGGDGDLAAILKSLLAVQKENLEVERERLELEKQRLDFERFMGSQMMALGPVLGGLLQTVLAPKEEPETPQKGRKRSASSDMDWLKDNNKILKTLLTEGIKKYMMGEVESDPEEDSGIHNDENSNSSHNKP